MRRKKILFQSFNLGCGGVERFLSGIVHYLKGTSVEPVCIFYDRTRFYPLPRGTRTHICSEKSSFQQIKALKKIIEQERPDVVCGVLDSVEIIIASLCASHNHRLVVSVPATLSEFFSKGRMGAGYRRFAARWISELYPKTDAVVAVSAGVKRDLVRQFGVPSSHIEVIYNGVDWRRVRELADKRIYGHPWFSENVPIITNVGSLTCAKNHSCLLKAFKLARQRLECRLVVVGEGGLRHRLEAEAEKLKISEHVDFCGLKKNPFKFMAHSSLFVLSSLTEGFPTVLLEAMACGVPVVSTDCDSGPGELIRNNKNGILVPPDDPERMSRAILRVLRNDSAAEKLAVAGKRTVRKYGLEKMHARYMKVFFPEGYRVRSD